MTGGIRSQERPGVGKTQANHKMREVCGILALIRLTAFDRKNNISHILLSSWQNHLLSSACSIPGFLQPMFPQLFQILPEIGSKLFEICVVRFHHTHWCLVSLVPSLVSVFGVTLSWQIICKDNLREAFNWTVILESLVHHGQLHRIWIHGWALRWQSHGEMATHIQVDRNQSERQEGVKNQTPKAALTKFLN